MQIETFALYCDQRLAAWGIACRGGLSSLGYKSINTLHPKCGVIGKESPAFTPFIFQTEGLVCQLRKESELEAMAIESVYVRGHEEKRESSVFKTAFDKIRERFWTLGQPS